MTQAVISTFPREWFAPLDWILIRKSNGLNDGSFCSLGKNLGMFQAFPSCSTSVKKVSFRKQELPKRGSVEFMRNMIDSMSSSDSSKLPGLTSQLGTGSRTNSSIFDIAGTTMRNLPSNSKAPSTGSLGDLSRTMELDRRKDSRKSELSPQAREALRMAYECLAETLDMVVTPELMTIWSSHRKASTVNGYANSFRLWDNYCKSEGVKSLPVDARRFAAWLAAASLEDKTASPTDNRSAAVLYFNSIVSKKEPDHMNLVRMTKESIRRRLGYKAQAKKPLLQDQVDTLVSHFLSQPTIQGLANAFRVSLAYEATLRWDDYADMTLGDFIVTNDFVRVFLVETKTDSHKTGQWATFAASLRPNSAYQLYRRLVVALSDELDPEKIAQWPVMFKGDCGSFGQFSAINTPKINYQEFLRILKGGCESINLDSSLFGTHSMRRGQVTDQFRFGIPDQVIKTSGRWKSQAFERYIDKEMTLHLHLRAIQAMEASRV
jgi:hypothetical protein